MIFFSIGEHYAKVFVKVNIDYTTFQGYFLFYDKIQNLDLDLTLSATFGILLGTRYVQRKSRKKSLNEDKKLVKSTHLPRYRIKLLLDSSCLLDFVKENHILKFGQIRNPCFRKM